MRGDAIIVEGLTKKFGDLMAVNNVSFEVKRGEIFGFLGPNGAGKTTTIKMLVTLLRPTSGTASVAGHDIIKDPHGVRRSIGVVFQNPALDDQLTGRENLDYHARMYGMEKEEREKRIEELLEMVGLREKADILVKHYSGGMKRRLEIARGLMHSPEVLFLDEPTLGLDTQTRRAIWDYIKEMNKEEGVTIFLTTHYMDEAEVLCDRVAIIDYGKILVIDEPERLKNMIGRDVIYMECSDPELLVRKVDGLAESVKVRGKRVVLGVRDGERRIPELINMARDAGVEIYSINMRKPSLEDVFIYYTGRRIREEV